MVSPGVLRQMGGLDTSRIPRGREVGGERLPPLVSCQCQARAVARCVICRFHPAAGYSPVPIPRCPVWVGGREASEARRKSSSSRQAAAMEPL